MASLVVAVDEQDNVQPKSFYKKGLSGFNCFVRENAGKLNGIKTWGKKWMELEEDERLQFSKKAKEETQKVMMSKSSLLKQLSLVLQDLHEHHKVDLVCLGHDQDLNDQYHFGHGNPYKYTKNKLVDLYNYCKLRTAGPIEDSLGDLRKKAQAHLNNLFKQGNGKGECFPYKSYKDGHFQILGLPDVLNPLKSPSSYGKKKLEIILSLTCLHIVYKDAGEVATENINTAHHNTQTSPNTPAQHDTRASPNTLPQHNTQASPNTLSDTQIPSNTQTSNNTQADTQRPPNTQTSNNTEADMQRPSNTQTSQADTQTSHNTLKNIQTSPVTQTSPTANTPTEQLHTPYILGDSFNITTIPTDAPLDATEYEVESIIKKRKRNGNIEYLLRWKGFHPSSDTWERQKNVNKHLLKIGKKMKISM